ncbi:MAG: competence protein ComEA [Candidatus Aldehydirespiratoraceae bacterium]
MDIGRRVSDWLGSLADRLGITPAAIVGGALAVAVAGFGGWWAFRTPDPVPVEQVLPRASDSGPVVTAAADPTSSPLVVVVHVDGAVAHPGVHELFPGGRVIDAVEAAGGLLVESDRERLNLAAIVNDGQRVWVPFVGEDEPAVVGPVGGDAETTTASIGTINLNDADSAALETLPGIGPSIAAAILQHREQEGRFERVEDLLEVAGIGPARLDQLEALVTV